MPSKDYLAWQKARHDELSAPDSWLGLIGLCWLEPGVNSVGSAAAAVVRLPSGPAQLGDLRCEGGRIFWQALGELSVELETDRLGKPTTVVDDENLSFFIVDRDGRLAVRLRDRQWAVRQVFSGIDYFPFDAAWQIEAIWQPLSPPLRMEVADMSGHIKTLEIGYQAVFEVAGQRLGLLPVTVSEDEVFFVFRDRSSGKESYGAGRFLKASAPVDGKISLDFNRAYNPPCAFTSFASCPLPPLENCLPCAVYAGERKWQAGR